jgi:hypothetical protein
MPQVRGHETRPPGAGPSRDAWTPWSRLDRGATGLAVLFGALSALVPPVIHADRLPGADTVAVRFEVGASSEYTNELYYDDAYADTTFLGRRLVETPEPRHAGVLYTVIEGTRGRRRASWQIQNELSLGDKLKRDALGIVWRDDFAPDWRLVLTPGFEWRHDRSFDRDQEEMRGSFRGRLRRSFADETRAVELGAFADLVRSSGAGSEFLPDRNAARMSLALDHLGLLGDEWRVGYSLAVRAFPDSATRDHLEHGWEGRWRRPFGDGHVIAIESTGRRRQTRRSVTTSRDNYWEEAVSLEGDWRASDRWAFRSRLEGEALQYDLEEPDVYFDYQVARAQLGMRFESAGRWSLGVGPRAERLWSPLSPAEAYREIVGVIEFERLGGRSLWNVASSAGWRDYLAGSTDAISAGLHSSYAYYGLDAFVDQPLAEHLRVRAITGLRYEAHTDPSQDAASIHLSLQIRWGGY